MEDQKATFLMEEYFSRRDFETKMENTFKSNPRIISTAIEAMVQNSCRSCNSEKKEMRDDSIFQIQKFENTLQDLFHNHQTDSIVLEEDELDFDIMPIVTLISKKKPSLESGEHLSYDTHMRTAYNSLILEVSKKFQCMKWLPAYKSDIKMAEIYQSNTSQFVSIDNVLAIFAINFQKAFFHGIKTINGVSLPDQSSIAQDLKTKLRKKIDNLNNREAAKRKRSEK